MATDWTLYLVTDPDLGGGPERVPEIVDKAVKGGVSVVQLRDKHAPRISRSNDEGAIAHQLVRARCGAQSE